MAADSPERAQRTRRFQLVNDAYYTLSDAGRRRAYDAQRRSFRFPSAGTGSGDEGTETEYKDPFEAAEAAEAEAAAAGGAGPSVGGAAYSWAWNFFSGMNGNKGAPSAAAEEARQRAEDAQFADVFEEMLREEGMAEPGGPNGTARPTSKFWSVVGGISGGALGFIVANVPGLVAGAVAGNRLGAIRDAKGKSVYAVFQVSGGVRIGGRGSDDESEGSWWSGSARFETGGDREARERIQQQQGRRQRQRRRPQAQENAYPDGEWWPSDDDEDEDEDEERARREQQRQQRRERRRRQRAAEAGQQQDNSRENAFA